MTDPSPTDSTPAAAKAPDRVPFRSIFAWAIGGIGSNYALSSLNALALPIYNIGLGVNAVKLGWALSFPRVIDTFFDPWLGWVSDNTRSRWGRRKPYIIAGAFPLAILTVLLWIPPAKAGPDTIYWYFLIISILYYLAFSVGSVPYTALGYEMSIDYNERTRIMAWQSIVGLIGGLGVSWLYWMTLRPVFGSNEVMGVRWVGVMLAVVIFATSIAPGIYCKERFAHSATSPIGLVDSFRYTLKNKPYRILFSATLLTVIITNMVSPCLYYVDIFAICRSKAQASAVVACAGTVQGLAAFLGVPFNTWLSKIFGKRNAALICLGVTTGGYALYAVFLTPKHPYYQVIAAFVVGWGIQGVWIMCQSMTADICDDDELKSGHRREAFYGSASGICSKAGLALAAVMSGYIVHIAGYHENVPVQPEAMERMKNIFIWSQVAGLTVCGMIFCAYPLTRARVTEIRAVLDARKIT